MVLSYTIKVSFHLIKIARSLYTKIIDLSLSLARRRRLRTIAELNSAGEAVNERKRATSVTPRRCDC